MTNINSLTDTEIVDALLRRDPFVTKEYFYKKCYPLFKSIHDRFYTDCTDVVEFINEIYLFVAMPQKSGVSKLSTFGFKCSLTMWLKIVAVNFVKAKYAKHRSTVEISEFNGDRNEPETESLSLNVDSINAHDVDKLLSMIKNERYRRIIELCYLRELSNEEAAKELDMSMDNFYNKKRLAKLQFQTMLKQEDYYGKF